MSEDIKVIHNEDKLTQKCRDVIAEPNTKDGSIWESEEMANDILRRSGYKLCEDCCTIMIIEDYE